MLHRAGEPSERGTRAARMSDHHKKARLAREVGISRETLYQYLRTET